MKGTISQEMSTPKYNSLGSLKYFAEVMYSKIISTPSFGGKVKPSVPCRRFASCKRFLNLCGSRNLWQNYRTNFSPTVPPSATRISHVVADVQAPGGENGNV